MSIFVARLHDLRESLIREFGEQEPIAEIKLSPETYHLFIMSMITERKMFYGSHILFSDVANFRLMGIRITCDRGEK